MAVAKDVIKPNIKPVLGPKSAPPKVKGTFRDIVEKYEPSTVWERLDMLKMTKKKNLTTEEENNYMLNGMDPTDELLRLKVANGDASIPLMQGRRYWSPAGRQTWEANDPWQLNKRLNELMKQAIYQTRNKMIIMQTLRDRYKHTGLYKMGFLIARCDFHAKTFASFSFKALQHCHVQENQMGQKGMRLYFIDIIHTIERSLHLWFEQDLLFELLEKNHVNAQNIVSKYKKKKRTVLSDTFIW